MAPEALVPGLPLYPDARFTRRRHRDLGVALPRPPRLPAGMGYGGNGITFSQIASEIVSSAIGGVDDTDAKLFAFNR